jgi:ABC-type transport system involved in multi-copper enzyme maturation permease subunit
MSLPSAAADFPPPAITPNALSAFGGIWRLTRWRAFAAGQWRFIAGLAIALGIVTYFSTDAGRYRDFAFWACKYVLLVVPTLAFLSGAALVREDMKPVAVDYLLSRPIQRPLFVVFRFACHLVCVQITYLLALIAVIGVGVVRDVPGAMAIVPDLLLAQAMSVTAFLALGFLFGSLTNRYLVLGILYGSAIELGLGNTSDFGLGAVNVQLSKFSVLHHVNGMLNDVRPGIVDDVASGGVLQAGGYVIVFTAVALGLAAIRFSMRELSGARPKES